MSVGGTCTCSHRGGLHPHGPASLPSKPSRCFLDLQILSDVAPSGCCGLGIFISIRYRNSFLQPLISASLAPPGGNGASSSTQHHMTPVRMEKRCPHTTLTLSTLALSTLALSTLTLSLLLDGSCQIPRKIAPNSLA